MDLNELELTLLEGLLTKHPSLSVHIPFLRAVKREVVSTGMLVELEYEKFDGPFDDINALFSNGELVQVPNLKKSLAYVIDITDGRITSIEFVTYGEKWNGRFSEFSIIENSPD